MYYYSKKESNVSQNQDLPTINLIIPMYNEEKVIKEKIQNTNNINYPKDKLKVLLLDDHSNDNSVEKALEGIDTFGLHADVLTSKGGKGKARALNWLFPSLDSDITVISDADALLDSDSLLQIVKHYSDSDIGGVTGKIVILSDKNRYSKSHEDSYRLYFDIWRKGESNIESVSVCNGPLMSFRTCILRDINIDPEAYADDSDLLFKVIRKGYRVVYDSKALVYERVPLSLKGRTIQKMKRINGLRKIYLNNLDLLGNGKFGKVIYPYALLTHLISPILVLLLVILYPLILLQNWVYILLCGFFLLPKLGNTLLSFVTTQIIMNFSFLVPTSGSWEAVSDARYKLK
jgi:cellulose synthase/poly-beta-1,6-N-acetylglucosamine synthase-like glycosyltransferase